MDVWMQKHRTTRWMEKLFVVLALLVSCGAQAELDQVSPKTSPFYMNTLCSLPGNGACEFTSLVDACNSHFSSPWGLTYNETFVRLIQIEPYAYQCNYNYDGWGGHQVDMPLGVINVYVTCPTPTVHPEIPYVFNPVSGMCERPAQATCPVTPLTQPPFSDACSTSLEAGKGADVNNKCGTLREPDMVAAAACIAKKIKALSTPKITYAGPSATIRTTAYQNHLLEIWTKSQRLDTLMNSLSFTPEYSASMKQACAQRKLEIDGELKNHAIDSQPSSSESKAPHVEHRAIDVPRNVARALISQVTIYTTTYTMVNGRNRPMRTITSDVEDYIHSATINPPACDPKISWGGGFDPIDRVHFQLP